MRRRGAGEKKSKYLMTAKSNPEVFLICVAQGWCSAEGMTYQDARKVTNISDYFNANNNITHFEELEYFGITSIPSYAFFRDTKLKVIKLPNIITAINGRAFSQCDSLLYLDIPASVTSISASAFIYGSSNNGSMLYIKLYPTTPPSIIASTGYKILDGTNDCPIYVPDESVEAYKAATGWSALASRIYPISEFVQP
jgi:hypothetical protein